MTDFKERIRTKSTIFWDWNGTLLNDSQICIDAMNRMRKKYQYQPIDRNMYEETFDFPVENYYRNIGWDFQKHPFRDIGIEFMEYYEHDIYEAKIQKGAQKVIEKLENDGKQQFLVSAMENGLLHKLTKFYGVKSWFDRVQGIEDHYGNGKAHLFESLIQKYGLAPENILMMGDTLHDAEIAAELGIDCILLYSGHQAYSRLKRAGFPVIESYDELLTALPPET